jgi:NAD(P)-dependent dehydrogenase (short-subunit alcohol dehydrogenase family)
MEFAGKVAIVTGASRGIGRAVAEMLAERGASLVLVGMDKARIETVARDIGRGAIPVSGDVARAETAVAAVDAAITGFGKLDILANIAGAFPTALLQDMTDDQFAESIATNLQGTFAFCRAALPVMRKQGGGAIVNISSMAARFPTPGLSVYGASKAGVEAFSRSIAVEAAPEVRVNVVAAGPTATETVRALIEADTTGATAAVTKSLPLGRLAEPREIAEVVLFLASQRASCMTGQVVHANCGGLMA